MQNIYKDNIKFLKTTMHLAYEALREYQHLWFKLLKPFNLVQPSLGINYEEEREGVQKKGPLFLSELYGLCKDDQSKEFNMYEIGKGLGFDKSETEHIVENLSRAELIKHDKFSDKVAITPYGIMMIRGEITVGYAPVH